MSLTRLVLKLHMGPIHSNYCADLASRDRMPEGNGVAFAVPAIFIKDLFCLRVRGGGPTLRAVCGRLNNVSSYCGDLAYL